ncbi:MAG: S8 family serine peptidase, partial [Pseudomonadota bacterium]
MADKQTFYQNTGNSFVNSDLANSVGGALARLHAEYDAFSNSRVGLNGLTAFQSSDDLLNVTDGSVVIEVTANDGDGAALFEELQSLGMTAGGYFSNMASGLFPIANLDQLPQLSSMAFAAPAYAISNVGIAENQGDESMNANDIRAAFGVDGTGVTVGILSDSFDTSPTASDDYADNIASGDLPNNVNVLSDLPTASGNIDEGRAMAQLIHDVVPGADLEFATAFLGQPAFAQSIIDLAVNSDVIVDDIGYFTSPFFQDGVVAQAVDTVFAAGRSYYSSAGNQARASYEAPFVQGPTLTVNATNLSVTGNWHDFDPGAGVDIAQNFTLGAGTSMTISLQWDEPFLSGAAGSGGSASDLDIFLLNTDTNTFVAASASNNLGGDPVELFSYTNTSGGAQNLALLIDRFSGPAPNELKYVDFRSRTLETAEYATLSGTSVGHNSAEGGLGVGAAFYQDTPDFTGTKPETAPRLESFSSTGGTPIYFDVNGNRLATPEDRQRVDITAPDGVDTTFFGSSDPDGTGFNNFFGTSAAAPNAAALAALMLEIDNTLTPTEIYDAMERTAIDVNITRDGFVLDEGYDDSSGFGLIDGQRALGFVGAQAAGDDFGETPGTAGALTIGSSATGEVEFAGDHDWFAVTLNQDVAYQFDLLGDVGGANGGTLPDAIIDGIFDAAQNRIPGTLDDDSGTGLNARLTFTAPTTGTFYVSARGFDQDVGTYTLSGAALAPDYAAENLAVTNSTPTFGEAVNLSFDARNLGPDTGPIGVEFGVYLSTDSTVTTADRFVEMLSTDNITAVGATDALASLGTLGMADLTPGTYFLGVIADAGNNIAENNEANNVSNVVQLTIGQAPVTLSDSTNAPQASFLTIQDAVTQASDNDNIFVSDSTYTAGPETVDVTANLLDVLIASSSDSAVFNLASGGPADFRTFGNGAVEINGNEIGNSLQSASNADLINGEGGDDTLFGFEGDDTLDGGAEEDTASYFNSNENLSINIGSGVAIAGLLGTDTLIDIENLIGGSGNDTVFGSGVDNVIEGRDGGDLLAGLDGNDTLLGGEGMDSLSGGNDADSLDGGAADDRLFGNNGNDLINGG